MLVSSVRISAAPACIRPSSLSPAVDRLTETGAQPLLPGTDCSARLLANALTEKGFVTMRYDKRAAGPHARENLPRLVGKMSRQGHVLLQTARFEELPGNRTKLTSQSVFQSVEDRDGMLQSGIEEGVNDSYERLDELLEKLQNKNVK